MDEQSATPLDGVEVILLNALIDYHDDERLLVDEGSVEVIDRVLAEAFTPEERSTLGERLERLATIERGEFEELDPELTDLVGEFTRVCGELGVEAWIDHRFHEEFTAAYAGVYEYLRTGEADELADLDLPPDLWAHLEAGLEHLDDDEPAAAASAFEAGVDAADTEEETVVAGALAGWTRGVVGGENQTALDLLEELPVDSDPWLLRLVTFAAAYDEAGRIADGEITVELFIRFVFTDPDRRAIDVAVGHPMSDERILWTRADVPTGGPEVGGEYGEVLDTSRTVFVGRITPVTWFQFSLGGTLPDIPQIASYYLGVGAREAGADRLLDVGPVLTIGPEGVDGREQLSLRLDG